jgi:drug/metabolite transporter (DMT)-like permease
MTLGREGRANRVVHLLAAGSIAANATGNCLLRAGMTSVGTIVSVSPLDYLKAFGNVLVIVGVVVLIVWMLLQLCLLSWADLTYVLPVTSAAYVIITLAGVFGLGEHVSVAHWFGVLLILCGVIIVGRTRPLTSHGGER